MNASSFNQNLSPWNISKVRDMTQMFEGTAMDQSLCWDLKDVQDTTGMMGGTKTRIECLPSALLSDYPSQMPSENPNEVPSGSPSVTPSNAPTVSQKGESGQGKSAGVIYGWKMWNVIVG